MILSLKNMLMTSLFLFAISLSMWSIFVSSKSQTVVAENFLDEPDALMEDVVATIINKQGKPALKLETPRMVHYPKNNMTELTAPHVIIFRESPQPWHVNADHAKTSNGIDEITFWDNVVIRHFADHDNPLTTMLTSTLTVLPSQQVARTDQAITVTQPAATIQAIGMLANLTDGTIKLLSNAREEYVPKN